MKTTSIDNEVFYREVSEMEAQEGALNFVR